MKTFELALGIVLIVACHALGIWWSFRDRAWSPVQIGLFRDPIGTVKVIVLGLGMLAGGGFMLWLWSR